MQIAPLYVGDTSYIDFVYNVIVFFLFHEEKADGAWKFQIEQHIKCELNIADRSIKLRARIIMAILGSRGLLEWLLIAEDEFVEKL